MIIHLQRRLSASAIILPLFYFLYLSANGEVKSLKKSGSVAAHSAKLFHRYVCRYERKPYEPLEEAASCQKAALVALFSAAFDRFYKDNCHQNTV